MHQVQQLSQAENQPPGPVQVLRVQQLSAVHSNASGSSSSPVQLGDGGQLGSHPGQSRSGSEVQHQARLEWDASGDGGLGAVRWLPNKCIWHSHKIDVQRLHPPGESLEPYL